MRRANSKMSVRVVLPTSAEELIQRARVLLNSAKLSNLDPDLLEWAEVVQCCLEQAAVS